MPGPAGRLQSRTLIQPLRGSTTMNMYRCLCGQPLAAFVVPAFGLPVGEGYVRTAVADALAAHLARLETEGTADREVHGVVSGHHGDGQPWVLDGAEGRTPHPGVML
jgi:hypothetical protein